MLLLLLILIGCNEPTVVPPELIEDGRDVCKDRGGIAKMIVDPSFTRHPYCVVYIHCADKNSGKNTVLMYDTFNYRDTK